MVRQSKLVLVLAAAVSAASASLATPAFAGDYSFDCSRGSGISLQKHGMKRELMQKISIVENLGFATRQSRMTVRTNSGEILVKEAMEAKPMSGDEIHAKFDRVCAGIVSNEARDRARAAWSNLRAAPDIAGPIATLAAFRPE